MNNYKKIQDLNLDSFDEPNNIIDRMKNDQTTIFPQVWDLDIENFKNNLDNIINKFKSESINQVITTKEKLLQEQKNNIEKSEFKNKNIISSNEKEISNLKIIINNMKEDLSQNKKKYLFLENKFKILRKKFIKNKQIAKYYYDIKFNQKNNKINNILNKCINKFYINKTKYKLFNEFKNLGLKKKIEKKFKIEKKIIQNNFENLIFKMKEENENINYELKQTKEKLKLESDAKNNIQKKIKTAFMKGIHAMNVEAMGSLNIDNILDSNNNNFTKNFQESDKKFESNKTYNNKKVICLNKLNSENKDHLWREAPLYNNK